MQIFFTVVKLGLVAAIIIGGFIMIGQGETQNFENAFEGSVTSPSAWSIAIYNGNNIKKLRCLISIKLHGFLVRLGNLFQNLVYVNNFIFIFKGMWSYEGWNNLNFVSQELENPTRNFPIVVGIGIPLGMNSNCIKIALKRFFVRPKTIHMK